MKHALYMSKWFKWLELYEHTVLLNNCKFAAPLNTLRIYSSACVRPPHSNY
jgi:hypothetical protein